MYCEKAKFQSYSWTYGTTSFRVSELKYLIERQLIRLKELWSEYPNASWQEIQNIYFDKLVEEGIAQPTAKRKDKDARQKTSSLKDLGLITEDRKLTEVGEKIYQIAKNNNFNFDNIFQIRNDSFIYFKQFLKIEFSKISNAKNYYDFKINPFLAIIYSILELGYLTREEFTYLIPTCKNFDEIKKLLEKIKKLQNRKDEKKFINKYIFNKIKNSPNYKSALKCLLENPLNEENFKIAYLDRKSKENAKFHFKLYKKIIEYYKNKHYWNEKKKLEKLQNILIALNSIKHKSKIYLKLYFFENKNFRKIKKEHIEIFEKKISLKNEINLYKFLFYLFQFYKWIVNLEEYYDLNRRFLNLTDALIFEDNKIYLDEMVYTYFEGINDDLLSESLLSLSKDDYTLRLQKNLSIKEILEQLYISDEEYFNNLKKKYPQIKKVHDIKKAIFDIKKEKKKEKFIHLIKNYFDNKTLKNLLEKIKERKDKEVKNYMDWEADIPTIFEYLVGILWYKLNNFKGDLTDFFNLQLDANLLPRRFASGNKADIIFKSFNEDVLLEVTLTSKDNQRKMELEPVSRHLGKYILKNNKNAYAVFIAPYLDPNVLVAFRAYKILNYYDSNNPKNYVNGLKIIPLSIDDLLIILDKDLNYEKLKKKFDEAFNHNEIDGYKWYKEILKGYL
jgi:hypothetical protein